VTSVLAQLRRPDLQELRVQCTLVSMPAKVAADCGLSAGKCVAVDEGQAGKVLKAAVAAKGTLCNLPEAGGMPLQPLVFERQGDERRLRLEMLPISEDEACFMFQMVQWRLPVDRTLLPDRKQIDAAIRLKVGAGAMAMAVKDDQATLVWLRFIGTRKAEPVPEPDAKDKGGNGR
jgi:hypothetical protein